MGPNAIRTCPYKRLGHRHKQSKVHVTNRSTKQERGTGRNQYYSQLALGFLASRTVRNRFFKVSFLTFMTWNILSSNSVEVVKHFTLQQKYPYHVPHAFMMILAVFRKPNCPSIMETFKSKCQQHSVAQNCDRWVWHRALDKVTGIWVLV